MKITDAWMTETLYALGRSGTMYWETLSKYGLYIFLFYFVGFWAGDSFSRQDIALMGVSLGVSLFFTFAIRYIVKRPRPAFSGNTFTPMMPAYSFPSAHAASAMSFAMTLSLLLLQRSDAFPVLVLVAGLVVLGLFIGLSRVMIGVHYVSDVLFGFLLGVLIPVFIMTV